ncbi:MAG: cold shock domain-containing protein [Allosphingosinicella sp.]
MPQMGTVKFYNQDKGYGVIALEDGSEAFVFHSHVRGGRRAILQEGQAVSLDAIDGPKGREARNVEPLG